MFIFYKKFGLSLIEILVALIILSTGIIVSMGVIARGLMMIKKGENLYIASNFAVAQFEAYKENFHMIPFYPGKPSPDDPSYYYPDRKSGNDVNQAGKYVNHKVNISDLPSDTYYGITGSSADFYHRAAPGGDITFPPYYDLNRDGFPNDIIEPFEPLEIKGVKFVPVVEIKMWTNGFDINKIKYMIVTVYWREKNSEGTEGAIKHLSIEGFISRTKPDPWGTFN